MTDLEPLDAPIEGQDDVTIQAAILWLRNRAPRIAVVGPDGVARIPEAGETPAEEAPFLPATWICVVRAGFARQAPGGELTLTVEGLYLQTDAGVTEAGAAE